MSNVRKTISLARQDSYWCTAGQLLVHCNMFGCFIIHGSLNLLAKQSSVSTSITCLILGDKL